MNAITENSILIPSSGELVSGAGAPLVRAKLRVDARGGLARVVCEQTFENKSAEPLHVTYSLPLPADAAVSGFAFRIGERRITGEIDRKRAARERFEMAVAEGRTAALLDQDRSSLFTQELGNIPPGETIIAEVTLDQRLVWIGSGQWEWRFPTTVMPRYLGGPGRVDDEAAVRQVVADSELAARIELEMLVRDAITGAAHSPSHTLGARQGEVGRAFFADDKGVRLDRDVVVRWNAGAVEVGTELDVGRPGSDGPMGADAYGLLTVVPPNAVSEATARDLIVLLDTSGSMSGEPLEQARRVVFAVLDTLGESDQLELIEFSNSARRWKKKPVRADEKAKSEARAWLSALRAMGSTEMADAVIEALKPLRTDAQRQVVLVTDGAIGFEKELVATVCEKLPGSSRLHTVGVGSAVNRSLTAPVARAGRGVEVIVGLGEDPERAARRLVERTAAPVLVGVEIRGSALLERAPARVPDVFAGSPLLVTTKLKSAGGNLVVSGTLPGGGRWERSLEVAPALINTGNAAIAACFARERVEDLEVELAAGGNAKAIDLEIERIGLDFRIATRKTSWVAVSEEPTVDPTEPTRRVRMPHEVPHGASVEGLGLRHGFANMLLAGAAAVGGAVRGGAVVSVSAAFEDTDLGAGDVERLYRGSAGDDDAADVEGKILVSNDKVLVIVITFDVEVEWAPGTLAFIEWDAATISGKVVAERTTAAGTIRAGQTVRVYIELGEAKPEGDPSRLAFPVRGRWIYARLSREK